MNADALGRPTHNLTPTVMDNGESKTEDDHDSEAAVHASYASVSWSIRSYICLGSGEVHEMEIEKLGCLGGTPIRAVM